jgi:hypothetical protein
MMPMPAGGPSRPTSYEFNEAENVTLASTAKYARWWGVISILGGVLLVLCAGVGLLVFGMMGSMLQKSGGVDFPKSAVFGGVVAAVGPLGVVYLISGVLYLQSGNALQQVVDTQGDDMPLCMRAMQTLSRAFMVEAIVTALAFLVGIVVGIASLGGKS